MLLYSTPNPGQGHASALSDYPQQQLNHVDDVTLYPDPNEEKITNAFQEIDPFSYQAHIDTGNTMQNNNHTDNTYNNNNIFFLYDDLFSDNYFIPSFRN
ncbi:hypothetical protein F8M41_018955 [Gigaspora margarita]|uniref:Uncharacterized protein n=1 Tax=Gigaspora margarita TaxID=4874 RepID=A0A8H4AKY2_GIGMA|nr:hypothetical protein F8M41_018955 [Gigaspora margarita]